MTLNYFLRRSIQVLASALTMICLGACKKFVQIGPPTSQLVTTSVFNNSASATSALVNIYIQMANNGESWNMSQNAGFSADELTNYSSNQLEEQLYKNALTPVNNPGCWLNAYSYIYQANAVISNLQNNGNITQAIEQQLVGESKFLRAFWHFYLTNMYGDVPIVTTTDYTVNGKISRSPKQQVYAQIISDLNQAKQLLNSDYVNVTDTTVTTDRGRPTKWAADAMLARVYLYVGKYDSAEYYSTQVINNNLYQLCQNLSIEMGTSNYVFQANSTEAIWQLTTPLPAYTNTQDALNFILTSAPNSYSNNITISPQLLNSFDSGDLRKTYWIGTYTTIDNPPINYYFPYKYQNATSNVTEYVMVLRLAEQFLIRAEARAFQGETAGAISDLNQIRNRAGVGSYLGPTDQTSLKMVILHERQLELFTEWGHRWFDMIRTGIVDSVMGGSLGVCYKKGGIWSATDSLYPVPQIDLTNDGNLTQNPGY